MNPENISRSFIRLGILLFLLGLLTGLGVPYFTNPRMGLSSHLEGILGGIFLAVLGLIWDRVKLSPRMETAAFRLALYGAYANWATPVLAAIFGTSSMTPIAGAGHHGEPWQEGLVNIGFVTLAVSMVATTVLVLWGLWKADRQAK